MQTIPFQILCGIIVLFTLFLLIIYIKNGSIKSIPFYFNILFGFIIASLNVLTIFPVKDKKDSFINSNFF